MGITKEELESLSPLIYHPIIYDKNGNHIDSLGYQGDPSGFYPVGLQDDSLFFYLELISGQCSSEADEGTITLYCQNIVNDSTILIDSFTISYLDPKTNQNDPYWLERGDYWNSCHDIYKDLIVLAPNYFLETITSLANLKTIYTFTNEPIQNVSFHFKDIEGKVPKPVNDMGFSRYYLENLKISAKSPIGKKDIFSIKNDPYMNEGHGEIAGAIYFNKSSRAIVVIDFRVGWFDSFKTIGCHLKAGFKK